jgi:hypothetical protein
LLPGKNGADLLVSREIVAKTLFANVCPVCAQSDFSPIFEVFSIPKLSLQRMTIQEGATDSGGARVAGFYPTDKIRLYVITPTRTRSGDVRIAD